MNRLVLDIHGVCSDLAVLIPQACLIFSEVSLVSTQTEGPDESLETPPARASGSQANWGREQCAHSKPGGVEYVWATVFNVSAGADMPSRTQMGRVGGLPGKNSWWASEYQ